MRRLPPTAAASAGPVAQPAHPGGAGWRRRPDRAHPSTAGPATGAPADPDLPADAWPPLSVVVPAFRETGVIQAKVADVRVNGARVLCSPERLGSSQALEAGFEAAGAPAVFAAPSQGLFLWVVALGGLRRYRRGDRHTTWALERGAGPGDT